ncbi:MAG: helix-turn-helix domain-containing protein [Mariniphaga sp.]
MKSRISFLLMICTQIAMVACQPKGNSNNKFSIREADNSRLQILDNLISYHYANNIDSSIWYLQKKIDLLKTLKQNGTAAEMYLYLTEIYQYRKYDGEKALSSITDAIHVFLDNPGLQIQNIYFFINLGNVLFSNGLNDEANFAYRQALAINRDLPFIKVLAMNNIALCYQKQLSYDSAAYYFRMANHTIPDKKDIMMAQNYNYINSLMVEKGQLDSVKYYHDQVELLIPQIDLKKFDADKIASENAHLEISRILTKSDYLIGSYFRMVQEYEKADSCFHIAINHAKSTGLDQLQANIYFNMAQVKKAMGKPERALFYADSALKLNLKTYDFKEIISTYELISTLHSHLNQTFLARDFKNLSQAWSDSLLNHENSAKLLNSKIFLASANTKLSFKELKYQQDIDSEIINQQKWVIYLLLFIFFLVFSGAIAFFAFRKKLTTTNLHLARRTNEVVEKQVVIDSHPKLAVPSHKGASDSLVSQLEHLIHTEKIYLDKNLSLIDLSHQLRTNTTYLSQVFNQQYKVPFHDYINELRVKEACRLLVTNDDKNITIDHIIPMAGFSTKSSFYGTFKKFTGVSPVHFKNMGRLEK